MKKKILQYKKGLVVASASLFLFQGFVLAEGNNDGVVTIPNPVRFESINEFLTELTNLLLALGVSLIGLMVIIGAAYIMIGGFNPKYVEKGKNIITWTILGTLVVVFARGILVLIQYIIGG